MPARKTDSLLLALVGVVAATVGCGASLPPFAGPGFLTHRDSNGRKVIIHAIAPESSAEAAGIAVGDEVEAIDAHEVARMSGVEVHQRLHGKHGSRVTVRVRRGDDVREVTIDREAVR